MALLPLVIALVILALLIWAVQRFMPGDGTLKNIICLVLVVGFVVYLLRALGVV